jgi:outer membrane protein TolC
MAAANAEIGVARSAFFPDVVLAAGGGLQSRNLSNLLNASSTFWSLGVGAVEDIFSGGRKQAQLDFARAGYQATVAGYRQTVLNAFQEVEDGLSGLSALADAAASQQQAVADAQKALALARNRYDGGLDPYINVITEQENLVNAQRLASQILGQQMVTSVALIKALGGGWDASSLAAVPLPADARQAWRQ